jgi:putative ABC transport system ATP-binding protein
MLIVENMEKHYITGKSQIQALKPLSFELNIGECLALYGPSGSGKTTLLNIIGCMTRPSSGRVYLENEEITSLPEHFLADIRRKKIGFIFQQFYLFYDLSALVNICLPLLPLGLPAVVRRQKAITLLEHFGLGERIDSPVGELSGGEQQRIAIARALINDPPVILADEPTSNMDEENGRLLLQILIELKHKGRLIIVASHDPLVLQSELVDRVCRLTKEG